MEFNVPGFDSQRIALDFTLKRRNVNWCQCQSMIYSYPFLKKDFGLCQSIKSICIWKKNVRYIFLKKSAFIQIMYLDVTPALVFEPLPDLGNPKRIWNPSCGLTPGAEVHFFLELSSASSQHPLTEQIDLVGIQLGNLYLLLIGLGQAKLYTLKPSTTAEVPSDMDSTTNNYNPTKLIHFVRISYILIIYLKNILTDKKIGTETEYKTGILDTMDFWSN